MSYQGDIAKRINTHNRRLQKLKQQQAYHGIDTPPEILLEIEDIHTELEKLETELSEIKKNAKKEPSETTIFNETLETNTRFNLKNIHSMLLNAFDERELRELIFLTPIFKDVEHKISETNTHREITNVLIRYCEQYGHLDQLLVLSKNHNPYQYIRHQPYYFGIENDLEILLEERNISALCEFLSSNTHLFSRLVENYQGGEYQLVDVLYPDEYGPENHVLRIVGNMIPYPWEFFHSFCIFCEPTGKIFDNNGNLSVDIKEAIAQIVKLREVYEYYEEDHYNISQLRRGYVSIRKDFILIGRRHEGFIEEKRLLAKKGRLQIKGASSIELLSYDIFYKT